MSRQEHAAWISVWRAIRAGWAVNLFFVVPVCQSRAFFNTCGLVIPWMYDCALQIWSLSNWEFRAAVRSSLFRWASFSASSLITIFAINS